MTGTVAAILTAGLVTTIAVAEIDPVPVTGGKEGESPKAIQASATMSNISDANKLALIETYCASCHNDLDLKGGLSMDDLQESDFKTGAHNDIWEKILHKLTLGEMPPKGKERPDKGELMQFTSWVEAQLDARGAANPEPGRAVLQRLNRVQYANAVRQLLDLDIDVSSQLPADDTGFGFDNIAAVLSVSPTLMDRYIVVAGRVASAATGVSSKNPATTEFKVPKDANAQNRGIPAVNERSSDDLPIDSRGGGAFKFNAPYDGEYAIRLTLNSNGLEDTEVEAANVVEFRTQLTAGVHTIGASFPRNLALVEAAQTVVSNSDGSDPIIPKYGVVVPKEKPTPQKLNVQVDGVRIKQIEVPSYNNGGGFYQATFPRDVLRIAVTGPYNAGSPGDTPSRRKVFTCTPSEALPEEACARRIFSNLAGQAYRRPATVGEVDRLLKVYRDARSDSDFEHGIEAGVQAILISPNFLFLREPARPSLPKGSIYRISDVEMATRLSMFLWSSIPDAELQSLAQKGKLKEPAVLKQQVNRMLKDPRSKALTSNFAGQWLFLRNLEAQRPDTAAFPNFDIRLRTSMRTETDMYFDYIVRENRPVLDFIRSDYSFLNERLAQHYGIANVKGPAFRKVTLPASSHRGGLLGQGSILTVTSYDNRTSIVKRGKWILDNLLAAPPPPPPPDIPALEASAGGKKLSVRAQMEIHRKNAICASCHNKMDPLGLALENFNADGSWRELDAGDKIDASTVLPDGTAFSGPSGLQDILLARKVSFTEAFTERLMVYALGRGLEPTDKPAIRAIRRKAAADGYRVNTIILGIVESLPFQKRKVPNT
jgi:mono/diheme cytochrome c family protein